MAGRLRRWCGAGMGALAIWASVLSTSSTGAPAPGMSPHPVHVKFYYDRLTGVDGRPGAQHALSALSDFDLLVVRNVRDLDTEERHVVRRLLDAGKQVFGYIDLVEAITPGREAAFRHAIEHTAGDGYTGVFFDQAGYDYAVTRQKLNEAVTYAHNLGLSVMANAWHPADLLDSRVHPTMNPTGLATLLGKGDWVLLESFYARSDDLYAGDPEGGFQIAMDKYVQAVELASARGVRVAGLTYHNTDSPLTDESGREQSLLLAAMLGLDGWAYGRSDNNDQVPWPSRPSLPVGTTYCSGLQQVRAFPALWMRVTDYGILWFEAQDNPLRRKAWVTPLWQNACTPPPLELPIPEALTPF